MPFNLFLFFAGPDQSSDLVRSITNTFLSQSFQSLHRIERSGWGRSALDFNPESSEFLHEPQVSMALNENLPGSVLLFQFYSETHTCLAVFEASADFLV